MLWRSRQPLETSCYLCRMGGAYIWGWKEGHRAEQGLAVPPQSLSWGMHHSRVPFSLLCPHPLYCTFLILGCIELLSSPEKAIYPSGIPLLFHFFSDRETPGSLFFWSELPPLSTKYCLLSPRNEAAPLPHFILCQSVSTLVFRPLLFFIHVESML